MKRIDEISAAHAKVAERNGLQWPPHTRVADSKPLRVNIPPTATFADAGPVFTGGYYGWSGPNQYWVGE